MTRDFTTPLDDADAMPDDVGQWVQGFNGDPAPEPVATQAVIMAAYAIVAYVAQRYAPTVFTPELDALVQIFLGAVLAWRTRSVVTALRGLVERR